MRDTGMAREQSEARPPRVWDTRDVERSAAFGYYREAICEAFMELAPEADDPVRETFRARVEHVPLGEGAVNRVRATAHEVIRTRREIARSREECFYLNYQTVGLSESGQAGRTVVLRPGEVGIFASGVPFALEHRRRPALGVASFFVPVRLLEERLPGGFPRLPAALSHDPVVGRLLTETARTLHESGAALPALAAARLFSTLLDLAALALGEAGGGSPRVDSFAARGEAAYLRIRRHVDERLDDPALDVAGTARALGISERWVHRLFEKAGTSFGAHLLEKRMILAAKRLRDPRWARLPIGTIAYDCGFADLSHFGRAFKARFAATPGEWRRGEGLS